MLQYVLQNKTFREFQWLPLIEADTIFIEFIPAEDVVKLCV